MSVRDFLNRGIHIADVTVAAGAIPVAAPTLITDGYATTTTHGSGGKIIPPFILVIVDLVAGAAPTATFGMYGWATPPAAGATLAANWQHIGDVVVSDTAGPNPTMFLVPAVGFDRFQVAISAITGAPTDVAYRIMAVSQHTADVLLAMGAVSGGTGSDVNLAAVAGTAAVVNPGVAGIMTVGGDVLHGAAASISAPAKVGGVLEANPAGGAGADAEMSHFILDLERMLFTRDKAYQSLINANAAVVNTHADNYNETPDVWADEGPDIAAGTTYYPNANGHAVGAKTRLAMHMSIRDGSFGFEASNNRIDWEPITRDVVDGNEGTSGFLPAHYSEPDAGVIEFLCRYDCPWRYIRAYFVSLDTSNLGEFEMTVEARAS